MKKILAFLLTLLLLLSLAGCSFLKTDMTMEQYMKKNRILYDTIAKVKSDEDCTMQFSHRGNSLVLTANMNFAVDEEQLVAVAAAMEESLEDGKEDYLELLEDVKEDVSAAESIIVEFYDSNKVLIISKEFR